ncbi:methylated-DNA--[protein]-cysteine S-methyltransferase [Aciditerrimonas ferrireducens]|uniref:methylated-DNA--[protein]-cysteine S-methyltransferase n=1 Tax=Aciditerrimonas ferrireducens TaxID=667306 RepID=UPI0020053582|nr:methylated-DNA--[protein]-cysteine S-methyltransferase [Aciditerrimonas ferrireducens]MCK4176072.1 methylated-DNA--[protein]-cysteine S-methyltransferase [Aciditerrimonas ferrireducens]
MLRRWPFETSVGPGVLLVGDRGLQGVVLGSERVGGGTGTPSDPGRPGRGGRAGDAGVVAFDRRIVPSWVEPAAAAVAAQLDGATPRTEDPPLDWTVVSLFTERVLRALGQVPAGTTASYGKVAAAIGAPGAARAVGRALAANPWPVLVPCHRVLRSDGQLGGYSGPGGVHLKARLLALEAGAAALGDPEAWRRVLASARERLGAADPALGRLMAAVGPCQWVPDGAQDTWSALARAVVAQQLAGPAVRAVRARLEAALGAVETGSPAERYLRVAEDRLAGVGLSGAKRAALGGLAEAARSGALLAMAELRTMADQAVIEHLCGFRGVGRWTAEMVLLFGLGRLDVLATDDYGLRRGLGVLRGGPAARPATAAELAEAGERWRPYRSVASWYLWRLAERPELLDAPTKTRRQASRRNAS